MVEELEWSTYLEWRKKKTVYPFPGSINSLWQRAQWTHRGDGARTDVNPGRVKGSQDGWRSWRCTVFWVSATINFPIFLIRIPCFPPLIVWWTLLWPMPTEQEGSKPATGEVALCFPQMFLIWNTLYIHWHLKIIPTLSHVFIDQKLCNCQSRLMINMSSPLPWAQGCTAARWGVSGGLSVDYRLGLGAQALPSFVILLTWSSPPPLSLLLTHSLREDQWWYVDLATLLQGVLDSRVGNAIPCRLF